MRLHAFNESNGISMSVPTKDRDTASADGSVAVANFRLSPALSVSDSLIAQVVNNVID